MTDITLVLFLMFLTSTVFLCVKYRRQNKKLRTAHGALAAFNVMPWQIDGNKYLEKLGSTIHALELRGDDMEDWPAAGSMVDICRDIKNISAEITEKSGVYRPVLETLASETIENRKALAHS